MVKHAGLHRGYLTVWHYVFCLTVVAFLFRALVPTGFMPDPAALRDGRLSITLCTANGAMLVTPLTLLTDTPATHSGHDTVANAECPFGLLMAQAVLPPVVSVAAIAAVFLRYVPHATYATLPPLPALGPPLGPRGPPRT